MLRNAFLRLLRLLREGFLDNLGLKLVAVVLALLAYEYVHRRALKESAAPPPAPTCPCACTTGQR